MRKIRSEKFAPFIFIGPAVIILLLIVIFPIIYSWSLSFAEWNLMRGGDWRYVGLRNYIYTLTQDPYFYTSLRVTVSFIIAAVGIEFLLGLVIALLLTRPIKRVGLYRTTLVIPSTMTPVVVGIIWRLLYNPELGTLNYFLRLFGLRPLNWLGDPQIALSSVIVADVWQWTPFVALILLAGLQSLPREPYEASIVDGASVFQTFRFITFPLLLPTIIVVLLLRIMDAFKTFDLVFVLTQGGPGMTTELLSYYTYRYGFKFFHMGRAAAMSLIIFAIVFVITQIFLKYYRAGEE